MKTQTLTLYLLKVCTNTYYSERLFTFWIGEFSVYESRIACVKHSSNKITMTLAIVCNENASDGIATFSIKMLQQKATVKKTPATFLVTLGKDLCVVSQ